MLPSMRRYVIYIRLKRSRLHDFANSWSDVDLYPASIISWVDSITKSNNGYFPLISMKICHVEWRMFGSEVHEHSSVLSK
jgi:hypothetical protein